MAVGGSPRRARRLSSTRRPGAPPEQRSDLCAYLLKTNMAGAWFPDGVPRRLPAFGLSSAGRAAGLHGLPARLSTLGFRLSAFGSRLSTLGFRLRGEISRLKVVTNPPESPKPRAQSRARRAEV